MEEQNPIENIITVSVAEQSPRFNKNQKIGIFGVFFALLALFIVGVSLSLQKAKNEKSAKQDQKVNKTLGIVSGTIVYGYWAGNSSIINALDLSTGNEATLATLANNVKHIKVRNSHEFYYINKTDQHDYGSELTIRNIENGSDKTAITADNGFGIDDYAISPNGQYVAVWMVGNSSSSVQFVGSPSRVYTVNVSNTEKHLIYDESSANGQTVHYPIAITNTGELFTDRFLPNSGAGWAYGMSVSDFAGTTKKDIDSMKNGTYSTQPVVSFDGKYLAFIGDDGVDGATVVDGFRKVFANANTLELFDLATQTRIRIAKGLSNKLYSSVSWDQISGRLIFPTIEKQDGKVTPFIYSYDTLTHNITKLSDTKSLDFVALIDDNNYLVAQKFQDESGLGNLGPRYSQGFSKLFVADATSTKQTSIPIKQAPIQIIAIKASKYFPAVENKGTKVSLSVQQLRLQTFAIKSELPKRTTQQSEPEPTGTLTDTRPLCNTFFIAPCNKLLGTNYTKKQFWDCSKKMAEKIEASLNPTIPRFYDNDAKFCDEFFATGFSACADNKRTFETCYDSPLYLYGENGTKVNVSIDTHTSNSNVSLVNNSFNATLNDGKINVGSNKVDSITFDYESRVRKLLPPTTGFVFKRENVSDGIGQISSRFGLNSRETQDLLNFAKTISSPFIFVSFYDQETSHNILPLYFDPTPDNYRNIVFYFKKLDSLPPVLPDKPIIEPVIRGGFTAIEISYMVR